MFSFLLRIPAWELSPLAFSAQEHLIKKNGEIDSGQSMFSKLEYKDTFI